MGVSIGRVSRHTAVEVQAELQVAEGGISPSGMEPIVIAGAGIAGLSLAWRLANEGRDVLVLEAEDRPGGAIHSRRRDGVLIEEGPFAIPARAVETLALVRDLGLGDHLIQAHSQVRNRFLLWRGQLRPFPQILRDPDFLPKTAVLRALAEPLFPRREPARADESVQAFVRRRFGHTVAERLADPLMAGWCAGDPRRLEVAAAFPEAARLEASGRSVLYAAIRGGLQVLPLTLRLYSFPSGMETLTSALAQALGPRLRLRAPVERIERAGARFRIHAHGGPYDAGTVVVSAPPGRAAAFVPEVSSELAAMPQAPVGVVHLCYRTRDLPGPLAGYGWLAPSMERTDVLGCIWASSAFSTHAHGLSLLRVLVGGARDSAFPKEADELVARARRIVAEVQGIVAEPLLTDAVVVSIPQYERGHGARMRRLTGAIPGLSFLGWGYTGMGVERALSAANGWMADPIAQHRVG